MPFRGILTLAMPDASATPNLDERVQVLVEAGNRADWDGVMQFFAPGAVFEAARRGTGLGDVREP